MKRIWALAFLCVVFVGGLAPVAARSAPRATFGNENVDPVLDGTAPVDGKALAELGRERSLMGAEWLAGVMRSNGAYYYGYDPLTDTYDTTDYNEVRHAGTTYTMFQAYGLFGSEEVLQAAEEAVGYIDRHSPRIGDEGRAFLDARDNTTVLGGQGLALVALAERRRVTGDASQDQLIEDLAKFMLSLEMPDEPGRYFFSFDHATRERLTTPDVVFYPGEALLAWTRLAQLFPDGPYLEAARRQADYLVYQRDGDLAELGEVPRDDHWLTIALAELFRAIPNDDYRAVAYLLADRKLSNQYTAEDARPELIGAAKRSDGDISFTSTATKGEAYVAAWALAKSVGDEEATARFANAAQRSAQFQMRVQYTAENSKDYPNPERAVGGWPQSFSNGYVRIDYVQHNIAVLIGMWYIENEGDIPTVLPAAEAAFAPTHLTSSDVSINLRREPSVSGDPIAVLSGGTPVSFRGTEAAGDDGQRWLRFATIDGAEGWLREGSFEPMRGKSDKERFLAPLKMTVGGN